MGKPSLKANFFVNHDGIAVKRAKPIKRHLAFNIYTNSDKLCSVCGIETFWGVGASRWGYNTYMRNAHIDHIFPRSRGGQNNLENLRVLCAKCNLSKGAA